LKEEYPKDILYQPHGKYGNVDFLKTDEKLIIDTKYKKTYIDSYEIEDIRQLAGYARDLGVLGKLKINDEDTVVDCIIIYPNVDSKKSFENRQLKETKIEQFTKFYTCGIRLPIK
jgi:5-methylcytosine-specific restriction enzyme subunit McrC